MVNENCIERFDRVGMKFLRIFSALHVPLSIAEIVLSLMYGKACPSHFMVGVRLLIAGIFGLVFGFSGGNAASLFGRMQMENDPETYISQTYTEIDPQDVQEIVEAREFQEIEESPENQEVKEALEAQELPEVLEAQEFQEIEESLENQEVKEALEAQELPEVLEAQEPTEVLEAQEFQEAEEAQEIYLSTKKRYFRKALEWFHYALGVFLFSLAVYRFVKLLNTYQDYMAILYPPSTITTSAPMTTAEPVDENTEFCLDVVIFSISSSIYHMSTTLTTTIIGVTSYCLHKRIRYKVSQRRCDGKKQ